MARFKRFKSRTGAVAEAWHSRCTICRGRLLGDGDPQARGWGDWLVPAAGDGGHQLGLTDPGSLAGSWGSEVGTAQRFPCLQVVETLVPFPPSIHSRNSLGFQSLDNPMTPTSNMHLSIARPVYPDLERHSGNVNVKTSRIRLGLRAAIDRCAIVYRVINCRPCSTRHSQSTFHAPFKWCSLNLHRPISPCVVAGGLTHVPRGTETAARLVPTSCTGDYRVVFATLGRLAKETWPGRFTSWKSLTSLHRDFPSLDLPVTSVRRSRLASRTRSRSTSSHTPGPVNRPPGNIPPILI